jgi:hypothetical protein
MIFVVSVILPGFTGFPCFSGFFGFPGFPGFQPIFLPSYNHSL